jgi:transcription termination factor NusB
LTSGTNDARFVAAELVFDVLEEREMLTEAHSALRDLPPEGRARAMKLARTTLRHLSNLDLCLKPYLRRKPVPAVHAILRVAVAEMLILGAPGHGVVAESVRNSGRIPSGKSATFQMMAPRDCKSSQPRAYPVGCAAVYRMHTAIRRPARSKPFWQRTHPTI